jgi:hypothetical protein
MELVEEVTLAEYYANFKKPLKKRGFQFLILALVRDGDIPLFYSDISRYWSSLNDLTGDKCLFAVAGPAKVLENKRFDWKKKEQVIVTPRHDAYGSLYTRYFVTQPVPDYRLPGRTMDRDYAMTAISHHSNRTSNDFQDAPSPSELARAGTNQVTELRRALGIAEENIPCLHFTCIALPSEPAFFIPLSSAGTATVYAEIKRFMHRIEHLSTRLELAHNRTEESDRKEIDELKSLCTIIIDACERQIGQSQHYDGLPERSIALVDTLIDQMRIETAGSSSSPDQRATVDEILELSLTRHKNKASFDRSRRLLNGLNQARVTKRHRAKLYQISNMAYGRFLSDLDKTEQAFQRFMPQDDGMRAAKGELRNARNAIFASVGDCNLDQLRDNLTHIVDLAVAGIGDRRAALIREMETDVATEMTAIASDARRVTEEVWEFFISYPTIDRAVGIEVFESIKDLGRTFLDHYCLVPSEDWHARIPAIQRTCKLTIALITENTPGAHYQNSEIQGAIELMRKGEHAILPVYVKRGLPAYFGLEQIHSVTKIRSVASQVREHLLSTRVVART